MNDRASGHPIADYLDERGIIAIAVIDDVFDLPTRADVDTTIHDFWSAVEEDEETVVDLSSLVGKQVSRAVDIDDGAVQAIWKGRSKHDRLKPLVDTLVAPIDDKLRPLETLRQRLEDELHRDTKCYGRLNQLLDTAPQMIFVDYSMNSRRNAEMGRAAKDIVSNINELYKAAAFKPIIVLMSSLEITHEMIEDFRQSTDLLAGMFYFIKKDDFRNADVFFLRICSFAQSVPAGHQIQALVDVLADRVHDVADRFIKDMRALRLSDYAYLQMMSLQEDGHPLGHYMLWLCGSYMGQILFTDDSVRARRKEIDRLVFTDLPAAQAPPSDMLARLYESATVEAVESELAHPRAPEGTAAEPHLHLGDIFVSTQAHEVLMIVNAQCDLEFAPGVATRPFKSNRAILMIPGKLQSLRESMNSSDAGKPRTEIFRYHEEYFRIVWDPKRLHSVVYGEVSQWLETASYELVARLRLPAALQLQQAFAADLTRVGLPTAPPIQRGATARLYCKCENGKAICLADHPDGGVLFSTRDGAKYVLTDEFVIAVMAQLDEAVVQLNKRAAFLQAKGAGEEALRQTRAAIDAVMQLAILHNVALRLREPYVPPPIGKTITFPDLPIAVQLGATVSGTYRYEQPLLIHLLEI